MPAVATVRRACALSASLLLAGAAHAASTTIFTEDFESYNVGGLDKNYAGGPNAAPNGSGNPWFGPLPPNAQVVKTESPVSSPSTTINPTSGEKMIRGSNNSFEFDSNWVNLGYRFNGGLPFTGGLRFDFQFFDPIGAGGTNLRDSASIGYYNTAPAGTDYPAGGALNSGASVVQNISFGASYTLDAGYSANFYQARIPGSTDGYDAAGWFNTTAARTVGWHHMRIDIAPAGSDGTNGLSFYVDDMATPVLVHNSVRNYGYNELELDLNYGAQSAYFDDLSLSRLLAGDANLDGTINADDFALTDRGAAKGLAGWSNGDFNGDGTVDANDYLLIDSAYAQQTGTLSPALLAQRQQEFGPAYAAALVAAVPEPTSLSLLALTTLPLLSRRRRSN